MKRNTKSALVLSIVSIIVCCTMLLGTTMAWFTDSVTSARNQIIAGNLDVEVYRGSVADGNEIDGNTVLFGTDASGNKILWEPGAVVYETLIVKNVGNLALKYNFELAELAYNTVTVDNVAYDLSDVIKVGVVTNADTADRNALVASVDEWFDLDDFVLASDAELLAKETTEPTTIVLYWAPSDSDNIYNLNNGKVADDNTDKLYIEFGLTLVATQLTYEKDSFDDKYDEDAKYDVAVKVSNATQLVSALQTATPGTVIDATGVSTDMSTIGTPSGGYTVLDVSAGTTIKGITLAFGSNQPIKTNVNEDVTEGEIVFEDCTFLSSGFSDSVYFQSGANATGVKLVFNNCTFAAAQVTVADNSGGGVEFNNCKFNVNSSGYGKVVCMGGNHTFNNCEFNISASKSIGSSSITKYGQINMYAENYTTTVTLNQCTNVPSVHKWAYNGTNTFVNNP